MATLTDIVKQLKRERDQLEKQLARVNAAISAFTGINGTQRRHVLSRGKSTYRSCTAKALG